jgi:hypothetical protein
MAEKKTGFSSKMTDHNQIKNWVIFETIIGFGHSKKEKGREN